MTRDDIIRMAQEVSQNFANRNYEDDLVEFFNMAYAAGAATEREACAKVCEDIPLPKNPPELTHLPTIERCAAAIRARGQ